MSKKKVYAIVLCLVLLIAVTLPGTLATDATQAEPSNDVPASEEPGTVQMPNEVTFVSGEKEGEKTTEGQTTENDSTGESTDAPVCNCEPVDGVHAETCPLNPDYEAPETPKTEGENTNPDQTNSSENTTETPEQKPEEQKECTCDPKPAEGEAHKEGCPLYEKPEEKPAELTHIDSCTAECTGENCACSCHVYRHIMACTTLDEIWAIIEKTPEAAFATLTEEQNAAIDAKITALEPEPAPEIVITPTTDVTVPSEIVYQTVNYTDVAPFGEPVTGGQN